MFAERSKTAVAGNNHVGYYHSYKYHSLDFLHRIEKMHGIRRVVIFCTLTTVLPTLLLVVPLYLRHSIYADVQFAVTESDIVEITDGISPIFCSAHNLKMNETFNAFQVSRRPEKTSYRKHIRLKKSMRLPDDTLEYWGFYLLKGATVALSVCSRLPGSSILVVKGERNLRTCGMLDHNKNKVKPNEKFEPDPQVKVIFESNAQEINSKELVSTMNDKESHQDARLNRTSEKLLEIKKKVTSKSNISSNIETIEKFETTIKPELLKIMSDEDKELNDFFDTAEGSLKKNENNKLDEQNSTDKTRHLKRRMTRLHILENENSKDQDVNDKPDDSHIKSVIHKRKHRKDLESRIKLSEKYKERMKLLEQELSLDHENEEDNHGKEQDTEVINERHKRSQQPIKPELLDRGIRHGGNAARNLTNDGDESISSFENGLLECYGRNVLLAHEFDSSSECNDVNYLLNGNKHMQTIHDVAEDGYYYYIFYSDNDFDANDLHAVFEIYKPTLQYENVTKACVNKTECSFPLSITSIDRVIVEVPTRDGIDHEMDDISILISTCVPRMGIYVIFPIAVLFLVLGCAFM